MKILAVFSFLVMAGCPESDPASPDASVAPDAGTFALRFSVFDSDTSGNEFMVNATPMMPDGQGNWTLTLEYANYEAAQADAPFTLRAVSSGMDVLTESVSIDDCVGRPWGTFLLEMRLNYVLHLGNFDTRCWDCLGDAGSTGGCN